MRCPDHPHVVYTVEYNEDQPEPMLTPQIAREACMRLMDDLLH